jgi:hypothetical protein
MNFKRTPYLLLFVLLAGAGVGTASALVTITLAGDVTITGDTTLQGDLGFSDDTKTITFPTTTLPNSPMIEMFSGGTSNAERTVIAHSPGFPDWGLKYRDVGDEFVFSSTQEQVTIGMANGDVEVNGDVAINGDLSVGGTNKLLFGKCTVSIGALNPDQVTLRQCGNVPGADINDEAIAIVKSSTGNANCLQLTGPDFSDFSPPTDLFFAIRNECGSDSVAQDVVVVYILFDVP